MALKQVQVKRRRRLKQQWFARFVAPNGRVLAHTESYSNVEDVVSMLATYFPNWKLEIDQ